MNRFKTILGGLSLFVLVAMLAGCTSTRRYVTHTVSAKDTVFTANNGGSTTPAPAPTPDPPPQPEADPAMDPEAAPEGETPDAPADDAAEGATDSAGAGEDVANGSAEPVAQTSTPTTPAPSSSSSSGPPTNWIFIAYGEVKETNLFIMRSYKTSSRILRCAINDDNSMDCTEQKAALNPLNPQGVEE